MINELYHSDIYLGQDFSDGIHHWKYIKKERKNGKWVYYYKDDKLNKKKKAMDDEINVIRYENKKRGYGDDGTAYYMIDGKDINDPTYNKLRKDTMTKSLDYAREAYRSNKRKKVYETTLIKALNTLSNASYNVGKAVNKGKKAIANLFKKKKKK